MMTTKTARWLDLLAYLLQHRFAVTRDQIFAQIRGWCGAPTSVRLTGSGAKSAVWCDILAQCIGEPLEVSDEAVEGRGAAIFAAVALGRFADYDAAGTAMVPVRGRYEPDPERREIFEEQYRAWRVALDANRALDGG